MAWNIHTQKVKHKSTQIQRMQRPYHHGLTHTYTESKTPESTTPGNVESLSLWPETYIHSEWNIRVHNLEHCRVSQLAETNTQHVEHLSTQTQMMNSLFPSGLKWHTASRSLSEQTQMMNRPRGWTDPVPMTRIRQTASRSLSERKQMVNRPCPHDQNQTNSK